MTGLPCTDALPSPLEHLACLARQHLLREAALLDTHLAGLRQVWAAVQGNDHQALLTVLRQQTDREAQHEPIQQERIQFRRQAALLLGRAPEEVHLGLLIEALGGEAGRQLEQEQQALRQKLQEAQGLRDRIANLTGHCLNFLNRFLLDLTGGLEGERYGPTGNLLSQSPEAAGRAAPSAAACPSVPPPGVLLEARG